MGLSNESCAALAQRADCALARMGHHIQVRRRQQFLASEEPGNCKTVTLSIPMMENRSSEVISVLCRFGGVKIDLSDLVSSTSASPFETRSRKRR